MTIRTTEPISGPGARLRWKSSCAPRRPTGWLSRRCCRVSGAIWRRCCPNTGVMVFLVMAWAKTSSAAGLCAIHGGSRRRVRSGYRIRRIGPRSAGTPCCPEWSRWCAWPTGPNAVGRPTCTWIITGRNPGARLCCKWPHCSALRNRRLWSETSIRSRNWRAGRTVSNSLRRRDVGRFMISRGGRGGPGLMAFC